MPAEKLPLDGLSCDYDIHRFMRDCFNARRRPDFNNPAIDREIELGADRYLQTKVVEAVLRLRRSGLFIER